MVKKGSILLMCMIALVAFAIWAPDANATPSLYVSNDCSGCHGGAVSGFTAATGTCDGCHHHGATNNPTAVPDKTNCAPGEMITVRINGGNQEGYIRAKLLNQDCSTVACDTRADCNADGCTIPTGSNVIAVASNPCPSCPFGVGGVDGTTTQYPVTLTATAPLTPGNYTWSASWYGNERDDIPPTEFNTTWVADSTNSGHGDQIVTFTFNVVECTTNADCDDGAFCNGAETCNAGACEPGTDPCPGETCDDANDVCIPDREPAVDVKVKVPRFINPKNRVTPVKLVSDMDVRFAEVTCEGATPKRLRQKYFSERDVTFAIGLFKTRELGIECGDMTLTCTGTLTDGTEFMGTSNKFKTVGRACKDKDDDDKDDDDDKRRRDKHDRDDD